jgi:hypothetical protein
VDKTPYWRVSVTEEISKRQYDALCFDSRISRLYLPHKDDFDVAEKDEMTFINFTTPKLFFPDIPTALKVSIISRTLDQAITIIMGSERNPINDLAHRMTYIERIHNYLYSKTLLMISEDIDLEDARETVDSEENSIACAFYKSEKEINNATEKS